MLSKLAFQHLLYLIYDHLLDLRLCLFLRLDTKARNLAQVNALHFFQHFYPFGAVELCRLLTERLKPGQVRHFNQAFVGACNGNRAKNRDSLTALQSTHGFE